MLFVGVFAGAVVESGQIFAEIGGPDQFFFWFFGALEYVLFNYIKRHHQLNRPPHVTLTLQKRDKIMQHLWQSPSVILHSFGAEETEDLVEFGGAGDAADGAGGGRVGE